MLSCDIRKVMAAALVLTTTLITMPVSAADFSAARPVIGSVSAVGSVDLRGVGISQEGTLFSGDSIRSHEKGYAKVLLGTGSKIELYEKTDVTLNSDKQGVKIAMNTGSLGITAKSMLRVDVAPFEITASDSAAANVVVVGPTTAGVHAINGKVTVKNLKTSESFVLLEGQEQLLGLVQGTHTKPLGQVASNVPTVPTVPQTPAGKTSNPGLAMDTGAWLAVLGAGALGAISIWALVEAHNNNNDINSLKNTINGLNGTIAANNAANAAAIKALQQCQAVQANLINQQAALAQVAATAEAGLAVLEAAGQANTTAAAGLRTSLAQAAAQQSSVSTLSTQAGGCSATTVTGLVTSTNTQVAATNNAIASFNTNLSAAKQQNPNIQGGNVQGVGPVTSISASVPA